jgi:hypothetical protein
MGKFPTDKRPDGLWSCLNSCSKVTLGKDPVASAWTLILFYCRLRNVETKTPLPHTGTSLLFVFILKNSIQK